MYQHQDKGTCHAHLPVNGKTILLPVFFLFLLFIQVLIPSEAAKRDIVLLVASKTTGAYATIIDEVRKTATVQNLDIKILAVSDFEKSSELARDSNVRLIVTIGTSAAQLVQKRANGKPVLNTIIPRESYYRIHGISATQSASNPRRSAIFIDQPLSRKIRLLRVALPKYRRIGVILGPHSMKLKKDIQQAGRLGGATVYIREVKKEEELVPSLTKLLDGVDLLLAIPDKQIFNRRTARNLLLITYRQKVPLVAYSRAYVNAGAILAVYSEPEELGRHIGETIKLVATGNNWKLPAAQYPRYFSIAVNERVARSMGIYIEDGKILKQKIEKSR